MQNSTDPYLLIQGYINSIKTEISSLTDKYNNSVREIWIKLTELETKMGKDAEWESRNRSSWYSSLPIIVSILALLASIATIVREFVIRAK